MNTMGYLKTNKFLILLSLVLLASCAGLKVVKKTPEDFYNSAITSFSQRKFEEARKYLLKSLSMKPSGEIKANALFYLGKIFYAEKLYSRAITYLTSYIEAYPEGKYFSEAVCLAGNIKPPSLKKWYEKIKPDLIPSGIEKGKCLANVGLIYWEKKKYGKALQILDLASSEFNSKKIRNFLYAIEKNILYSIPVSELIGIKFNSAHLSDLLILKLAEEGDFTHLASYQPSDDEELNKKFEYLKKIVEITHASAPARIFLLLPLNGAFAPVGTKLLEDTLYAINISSPISTGNTWGDRIFTALYFRQMRKKMNPVSIGPVLSWDLKEVLRLNRKFKIPVVTINSSFSELENDPYIIRINLTPEKIVKRLVDFAFKNGWKKFAIFNPENEYGATYANLFSREVTSRGGEVIWQIQYEENTQDFRFYFWKVLGIKDREDEKAFFENLKKKEYKPPVDAVFIPDSATTVSFLIPQFGYFGMDKLNFLCTRDVINPMDTDVLGDYTVFAAGNFYAFSDTAEVELFEEEFENHLGRVPTYWDAYQFIATRIVTYCSNRARSRSEFINCIKRPEGFKTFLGKIKIKSNGEAEIPVKIFSIKENEWVPLH